MSKCSNNDTFKDFYLVIIILVNSKKYAYDVLD